MHLTLPLGEARDTALVGAKASNLARLLNLGAPVPSATVVTNAALQMFLDRTALDEPIRVLCAGAAERSARSRRCAAETIAALFHTHQVPEEILRALDTEAVRIGSWPLIVRSSAIGEDSPDASFAGQLESIADVRCEGTLRRALVDVWASRWSDRALAYEHARGATLAGMGVIVQRQVAAVLSGVLFTVAPGDRSQMLIEYCAGLGDALVSGRENPGRVMLTRADLSLVAHAKLEVSSPYESTLLAPRSIEELARLALWIEGEFGVAQDIEWALDAEGHVWIVQARPITTLSTRQGGRSERESARGNRSDNRSGFTTHWSNANVCENFPAPITPLLYSIAAAGYYHYFRNLGRSFGISRGRLTRMEAPLRQIIGVHRARMYYNLTSIHSVLRSAPFGDLLASSFDGFVGSAPTVTPAASSLWRAGGGRLRQVLELCGIAVKTAWQYTWLTRRLERFEQRVTAFARGTHPERLHALSTPELVAAFRAFLDIRFHRWNDAALADAGSMVCHSILQKLLSRAFPSADQQALHNSLLKALPGLVSSIPAIRVWELSRRVRSDRRLERLFFEGSNHDILHALRHDTSLSSFARALAEFLDEWGFRCSGELMLTVPSFQEDPAPLLDLIRAYASTDAASPRTSLARQAAERREATARVARELRARPFVRHLPARLQSTLVMKVLAATQKCILLRERARLKQALLYSRLRRVVLTLGSRVVDTGHIDAAEDLFFLTADEIQLLVTGAEMFPDHVRDLVALRRQAHAELSAITPPDTMALETGGYFSPPIAASPTDCAISPEMVLQGVAASGGQTSARAAVLADVKEAARVARGDILVTRQTDPGWAPVFPLVSGLVVERGGLLSHGAVVAREFGIPSVVGIAGATRLIAHGTRIRVDGDRGLVHVGGTP